MDPNTKASVSTAAAVPCVDLTRDPETLKQGSEQWKLTAQEMKEALEMHGCCLVKYDAISNDDRARLHEAMHSMFNLPDETKCGGCCCEPEELYSRYVGKCSELPLYENVVVGDASQKATVEAFTRLFWPGGNDDFCNALHTVGGKMAALTRALNSMILDSYGLGTDLEAVAEATDALFKLMKYSAPGEELNALGLPAHADSSCLTVLGQNDVTGLRIKNNQGRWVEVDPSHGYFVVFVGQSMRVMTNGRLHATFHQVNVSGAEDRLSYSLFLMPKPDQIVDALPEMVDEEHPRLFEPTAYRELAEATRQEVMDGYM